MKRSELMRRAVECGVLQDVHGPAIHPVSHETSLKLVDSLTDYFENTAEGREVWENRPRIGGEGVKDYPSPRDTAEALVRGLIQERGRWEHE